MEMINPAELCKPSGYSHGVKISSSQLVFVAGQVGWNEQSRIVSPDFAPQFAKALENVLAVVRKAGGRPDNVARLTMYVLDRKEYLANLQEIGKAYRLQMGRHYPAMSVVEVRGLLEEGARLELEATAAL
jgi:enamine deaminase RidA (YjgF/YER057c/UK114 family)